MLSTVGAQSPGESRPMVILGQRSPSPVPSAGLYQTLAVDANGNLAVNGTVSGPLAAGSPLGTVGQMPAAIVAASPGLGLVPGDATSGLAVNLRSNLGGTIAYSTGVLVQGPVLHDEPTAGGPVLTGGYAHASGSLPTAVSGNGDAARLLVDRYGRPRVTLETAAGLPFPDDAAGMGVVAQDSSAAVGHSVAFEASHAGGVSEVTAKASAGLLKWIHVSNPNTTDVFLQIFNASNPTPGSTTPTLSFCIPGGTGASNRGCYNQEFGAVGVTMSTAITYTITTTASGSTAPGSACTVGIGYK